MKDILERVFNLIRKTGDKVVIVDQNDETAYVVMNLDDYEKMAGAARGRGLTEGRASDKIEKINQDIALWREEIKNKEEITPSAAESGVKGEEESQFYFEPVE